ncbi:hypothetical protein BKA63DRAFT_24298 [Paraphoma chrysanthemicola]|nr:hypothetical protein BKA63DRAFT_24298 [Paraphoma chrysanthemicola]
MVNRTITSVEQGESLAGIDVAWQDDHCDRTQQYDMIAVGGSSHLLTAQASRWRENPCQMDRVNHGVSSYYVYEQPPKTDPYPYPCQSRREPSANDFRADQTHDALIGFAMPGRYGQVTVPALTGWIQRVRPEYIGSSVARSLEAFPATRSCAYSKGTNMAIPSVYGGTGNDWTQLGQGNTNEIDLSVNAKDQSDCHQYAGLQRRTLATQPFDYSQSRRCSRQMKSRGGGLNHASTILSSNFDNLVARNGHGAEHTWGSEYAYGRNISIGSDQAVSSHMIMDLSSIIVDAGQGDHEQPRGVAIVVHPSSPEPEATLSHTFGHYEERWK